MTAPSLHARRHTSEWPRHDSIVAALRRREVYSDGTPLVEVIETHRAWVFLTSEHAYKLAKTGAGHRHDAASLAARRRLCEHELNLNRRLGRDVYRAVTSLARTPDGYRVDAPGPAVEWLIDMRRLPRSLMLDIAISRHSVRRAAVDALADVLHFFYQHAEPAPATGQEYRQRLLADIEAKQAVLGQPHYGLDRSSGERLAAALRGWVAHRTLQLERRARTLVDAHGDLRPEHVCLEPRPVVIDCLEFDAELRRLDPVSEIAFLALECRRLGAAWIGSRLLSRLALPLGLEIAELVRFYQGYHALVRAAVAIWHLDDPGQGHHERWRARAQRYVRLGLDIVEAPEVSAAPSTTSSHPFGCSDNTRRSS